MERRRFLLGSLAGILGAPGAGQTQPERGYRVAVLTSTTHFTGAFRQGLRELGYVEGQNLRIEERSTQGESARFADLVAEVLRSRIDVLVVSGIAAALAAQKATATVPIVFLGVSDPVGQGLVASLARPGANITGTSLALGEGFAGKWVELLREAVPRISQLAVLWNSTNPVAPTFVKEVQAAAQALQVKLELADVRAPGELDRAFTAIVAGRPGGLVVTPDPSSSPTGPAWWRSPTAGGSPPSTSSATSWRRAG